MTFVMYPPGQTLHPPQLYSMYERPISQPTVSAFTAWHENWLTRLKVIEGDQAFAMGLKNKSALPRYIKIMFVRKWVKQIANAVHTLPAEGATEPPTEIHDSGVDTKSLFHTDVNRFFLKKIKLF